MKKLIPVLFAVICLFAFPALSEPDHSMIRETDVKAYVYLQTDQDTGYTADYSCLLTNTETSWYVYGKLYAAFLDTDGNEVFRTSTGTDEIYLRPGETKAFCARRTNLTQEQRDCLASVRIEWEQCKKTSGKKYQANYEQRYIPLVIFDLKTDAGSDSGMIYACKTTNTLDHAISMKAVQVSLELYDPGNGQLLYSRILSDYNEDETEILPGHTRQFRWADPPGIYEIIGNRFDAKISFIYSADAGSASGRDGVSESDGAAVSVVKGDIVKFGYYEQDNHPENGPEEIEWIVLEVRNGKALLLSRYGLDTQPYNTKNDEVTWERCSLRTWLNGAFLNRAFTPEEQAGIVLTEVDNSSRQGSREWNTDGGNNTQDKVFLLSSAEAEKYLSVGPSAAGSVMKALAYPTPYAKQAGAAANDAGWWWLRSPGLNQHSAAVVDPDGAPDCRYVFNDAGCVRPALWIDPESGVF